jgi:transposase
VKYIGLDLHKRKIFATVLDGDGTILARNTIGAGRQDICHYLNKIKLKDSISVAMEASYNWQYAYGIVEGITDSIVLAHPLKTRIIGEAKIKTDKIDSYVLAYMLKSDMLPKAYVPTKLAMENKILLRSRISLVRLRTSIKNRIHAIIDRNKDCYSGLDSVTDIFGKIGTAILKNTTIASIDYRVLCQYLALIEDINSKISVLEKIISDRIAKDPDIEILKTIPGMGTITAFILKS